MNDTSKILLTQIPLYIIIIIFAILYFTSKGGDEISYKDVVNQMNQKDSIISQIIDAQGRLVIDHTNRPFNLSILKDSDNEQFRTLRNELKSVNLKVDDLKSAIKIQSESSGVGKTKIIRDTIDRYVFNDTTSSKFLKLKGTIDLKKDSMEYDYTYTANYSIYSYEYKKKFWKRPEMRIKLVSDDPSNKIKMQTFNVKPPREIVSIGVGFGASVYYANGSFGVAPAITIGIFKPIYTFRSKK